MSVMNLQAFFCQNGRWRPKQRGRQSHPPFIGIRLSQTSLALLGPIRIAVQLGRGRKSMQRAMLAGLTFFVLTSLLNAQDSVRLIEVFRPDYQYRVSCRVEIEGMLRLPADTLPKPPLAKGG